jgi:hypothetical protein
LGLKERGYSAYREAEKAKKELPVRLKRPKKSIS